MDSGIEFKVRITHGDLYINDKFVAQCCWGADEIGSAIADWYENNEED